jgi:fructose-1,6-bisphosphatase/inositol monophosphatase family enzyme
MGNGAELQLALRCSDLAAELALMHYRAGVEVTIKRDGTPVTEADRAVERLLHESIGAAVPEDALLGEEFGRLGDSERVWIIDPIDGTSFFSRRDPNWRVHIAFEASGRTEVAVVTAPALGRQWWATRGGGAFESSWPRLGDEVRLSVTSTSIMKEAVLDALDDDSRRRLPREATIAPPSPLALVELVRGEIDGFLAECCHVWDHAPWILLVEEAGGRFTDRTGGHGGDAGGGLYSNSGLHAELLAAIGYPTRP